MREERNIPFKNYIVLSIVLIISVVFVIYFYMWYSEFENSRVNVPILDDYLSVINYNELDNFLVENKSVILYISSLSDNETRRFEKKFRDVINRYSLNNDILYLDFTNQDNSLLHKYNILDLPCLVIFDDGNVIDTYSIKNNHYDIELLISYLKIEGVIND